MRALMWAFGHLIQDTRTLNATSHWKKDTWTGEEKIMLIQPCYNISHHEWKDWMAKRQERAALLCPSHPESAVKLGWALTPDTQYQLQSVTQYSPQLRQRVKPEIQRGEIELKRPQDWQGQQKSKGRQEVGGEGLGFRLTALHISLVSGHFSGFWLSFLANNTLKACDLCSDMPCCSLG